MSKSEVARPLTRQAEVARPLCRAEVARPLAEARRNRKGKTLDATAMDSDAARAAGRKDGRSESSSYVKSWRYCRAVDARKKKLHTHGISAMLRYVSCRFALFLRIPMKGANRKTHALQRLGVVLLSAAGFGLLGLRC